MKENTQKIYLTQTVKRTPLFWTSFRRFDCDSVKLVKTFTLHQRESASGGRGRVFLGETSRSIQREMKIGTWNVRILCGAGSLKAAARELARYKLDVAGVQEVGWDKWDTIRAGDYNFFYVKGNENHELGTGFFVHRRIVSAVKRVEFFLATGCHI